LHILGGSIVSQSNAGTGVIVAAVILGLAVVGSSFMVTTSLDRGSSEMGRAVAAIQEFKPAVPAKAAAAPSRPGRPDPDKVYQVAIGESPTKGPKNAKVQIVEFSDFQCPFCSRVTPTLDQVTKEYGDQVSISFKHMPLAFHSKAPEAHAAAQAAHLQGNFWEMHDLIFADQRALSRDKYIEYATQLNLDVEKFEKDMDSKAVKDQIEADKKQAAKLGVTGTPSLYINGRFLSGAQPFSSFKRLIDEQLGKKG
jgi:protein-disulfide isomerase